MNIKDAYCDSITNRNFTKTFAHVNMLNEQKAFE